MAYFCFDTRNIDGQSCHNLLSSLLTQLIYCSDLLCDVLSRIYWAHDYDVGQHTAVRLLSLAQARISTLLLDLVSGVGIVVRLR